MASPGAKLLQSRWFVPGIERDHRARRAAGKPVDGLRFRADDGRRCWNAMNHCA
ncbi:hypothetical protein [Nocardia sp. NBC_01329]|uniref:hypothetical protein n=1 Tax=Nocardia sp. NBC_01329 TaxID=2903594 RepID=UPI002E160723|nr:hypothetical protein OG405_21375 [Nocardia sp. NBC_01329]